jgi:immune inhibitor A
VNRIRLAAAVAASLVLSLIAALPANARPISPPAGLSAYDRALLAHTSLDPVVKGEQIMGGEDFSSAAEATPPTAGVTQNGVCNDQKAEAQVGETRIFWVHNFKLATDIQKTFVLMTKTSHVYFWVDVTQVGTLVTQEQADTASNHFETIYDTDRAYFGEPARCDQLPFRQPPRMQDIWGGQWYDADDDPHINIVNFDPDVGATVVAGYYSSADEYPKPVNEHSNEGEFFYMNSLLFAPGTTTYDSILAHEFYHMIQFANDANEETWVNEGMADVAIEVNGFASLTASHTSDYSVNAGDQLTNWDGQLYDYGNAYTYLSYLLEHYGPPDDPSTPLNEAYGLGDDITKVESDGIAGLDQVLAANPYAGQLAPYYQGRTANDVYLDRAVANVINDRSIDAGQYGYGTLSSFSVQLDDEFNSYPQDVTVEGGRVYGDHSYGFDSLGDGSFSVEADGRIQIVANTPTSGTHELWSNRADEMETWAVRAADLTGATAPHLRFSYWHDIEEDWDYAYLQVSDDGGATWTNLACCGSRNTNPNGNNRGNGITGRSLASPLDGEPSYLQADVDLSPYAGKQIQVRFLYVTDPAVNEPGFTLDDVSLVDGGTTIWPTATFESGADGFTLAGSGALTFQVIEPSLPNSLRLQLVNLGASVDVDRPPTSTGGSTVSAQGAMDATRTIAIVSSLTPITSETYDFTFHADASPPADLQAPVLRDPGDTVKRNKKFTLNWTAAGPAGNLAPQSYRLQEATVNAAPLADDAESGLGNWTVTTTGLGAIAWQESSQKSHSPDTAFWASAVEGATDTSALLTLKQPVAVPSGATTTLSFWDWQVNESDDQVAVEVSTNGGATWQPVFQSGRSMLADEAAAAFATEPMGEHRIDLAAFAGKSIRLRFRFSAGSANRSGSTPFGWYVDDVRIESQNWTTIATVTGLKQTLSRRTAGTYFYRVAANYSANVTGPWSNVVDLRVV